MDRLRLADIAIVIRFGSVGLRLDGVAIEWQALRAARFGDDGSGRRRFSSFLVSKVGLSVRVQTLIDRFQ